MKEGLTLVVPKTETHHFITCPHCQNGQHRVDHLFGDTPRHFGTWHCDNCGKGIEGEVRDYKVYIKKSDDTRVKQNTLVFLKHGDVMLVCKGLNFDEVLDKGHQDYFYNEHTCPINYLRRIIAVIDLKHMEADPHGIFEWVDTVPYENVEDSTAEYILSLIDYKKDESGEATS